MIGPLLAAAPDEATAFHEASTPGRPRRHGSVAGRRISVRLLAGRLHTEVGRGPGRASLRSPRTTASIGRRDGQKGPPAVRENSVQPGPRWGELRWRDVGPRCLPDRTRSPRRSTLVTFNGRAELLGRLSALVLLSLVGTGFVRITLLRLRVRTAYRLRRSGCAGGPTR